MKYYYVYAFNIKEKDITAALSFQDQETAKTAYEAAFQEIQKTQSPYGILPGCIYGFQFGYTENGIEIKDDDFTEISRVRIDYPLSSRRGYQEGNYSHKTFETDDFEAAECNTKNILKENIVPDDRQDIKFIRYVKLIADGVLASDIQNNEPTAIPLPATKEPIAPPVESNIADCPSMTQTANNKKKTTGSTAPPIFIAASSKKQQKQSALKMYNNGKVATEPDGVVIEEFDTDALKDIEQAVYSGTLRANIDSKQNGKKYERWARWKSGIGHTESAKYERPDLTSQAEKGNELAKKDLAALSEEIRKQVERFDKRLAKQSAKK